MKAKKASTRLRVFNPVSAVSITAENAPRFDTLRGKTICEISATGYWRSSVTFPIVRELMQKRFPDATFIPYTELPIGRTDRYPVPLEKVGELLKGKGCDAVILGNGG